MKIVLHLTIIMEMIANIFYLKTPKKIIKKKFNCEVPAISFSIQSLIVIVQTTNMTEEFYVRLC